MHVNSIKCIIYMLIMSFKKCFHFICIHTHSKDTLIYFVHALFFYVCNGMSRKIHKRGVNVDESKCAFILHHHTIITQLKHFLHRSLLTFVSSRLWLSAHCYFISMMYNEHTWGKESKHVNHTNTVKLNHYTR